MGSTSWARNCSRDTLSYLFCRFYSRNDSIIANMFANSLRRVEKVQYVSNNTHNDLQLIVERTEKDWMRVAIPETKIVTAC